MKTVEILEKLQKIADDLDDRGLHKAADMVTETMVSIAEETKKADNYGPNYEDEKRPDPGVKEYGDSGDDGPSPSLSVGTCPDHRGTRLIHVPGQDSVYQCPIDGKIYNWAEGFTDMAGTKYNGGRVDLQTPDSTDWSTPGRWFEGEGN